MVQSYILFNRNSVTSYVTVYVTVLRYVLRCHVGYNNYLSVFLTASTIASISMYPFGGVSSFDVRFLLCWDKSFTSNSLLSSASGNL